MYVAPIAPDQSPDRPFQALSPGPSQDQGFQRELDAVETRPSWPAVYTVQPGDTLSEITRDFLKGMGAPADAASIYGAVGKVARHNGIRNADMIVPGQRIDLSVLTPQAAPPNTHQGHHDIAAVPARRTSAHSSIVPLTQRPRSVHAVLPARGAQAVAGAERLRALAAVKPASPVVMAKVSGSEPWSQILDGPATLSSPFGHRNDPFTGKAGNHAGLDIAAPMGTKIASLLPGVVTFSGWKGGYGNMVIVDHGNGLESRYGHATKTMVREGDRVGAGQSIATVGSTGRSTGPHLHFEVRREGRPIDPMPILDNQRLQIAQRL